MIQQAVQPALIGHKPVPDTQLEVPAAEADKRACCRPAARLHIAEQHVESVRGAHRCFHACSALCFALHHEVLQILAGTLQV